MIIIYRRQDDAEFAEASRQTAERLFPGRQIVERNPQYWRKEDQDPADVIFAGSRWERLIDAYQQAGTLVNPAVPSTLPAVPTQKPISKRRR